MSQLVESDQADGLVLLEDMDPVCEDMDDTSSSYGGSMRSDSLCGDVCTAVECSTGDHDGARCNGGL